MARINANYDKLAAGYLFPEIAKRTKAFQAANPTAKILRLGIGNTTEPLTPTVVAGLHHGVDKLADVKTYTGYGDEQGDQRLREALVRHYSTRGVALDSSEIFVSDGAKCDVANIQSIFSLDNIVAVQDPAYPVYVDTNVIAGRTGGSSEDGRYGKMVYMPCTEENGFIPDLPTDKHSLYPNIQLRTDLIYLCSPNNPTGAVMPKSDLEKFVGYAKQNKSVIIFDAAYAPYISDPSLPQSIFEVEGAKDCAIEINSFSKIAGFTGVRLGWTVVPKALVAEDAPAGKLNSMWNRRQCTFFNGASNIVQEGGLYALSEEGREECQGLADFYMENAGIIRAGLESVGLKSFGGTNAPYIWMKTPNGMKSWDFFDKLLNEAHVVCTPGAGFGPNGEGYARLSAFGHRENIQAAVDSIKSNLRL